MHIYWASVYKLPQSTIAEIDKILKRFLWGHSDNVKGKAKVAWKYVCTPEDQGSLGLKSLQEWNEVLLIKQLWKLIEKKNSLWFNWVNLVKLKDKVKNHVYESDDGVVKSVTNSGKKVPYKTSQVWEDMRSVHQLVHWHQVIWFPQANPKHAFILWLIKLDRLTTQDKLAKWYPNLTFKCELCGNCEDSVKHLFFECNFSRMVWTELKKNLLFKGLPGDIQGIINTLARYPFRNQIWDVINRITVAAVAYHVWQERNNRIFKGKRRNANEVLMIVEDGIRMKLASLMVKNSLQVKRAAEIWGMQVEMGRLKLGIGASI
ncbi:uncharacterized protein [Rutidosis leptorrhynchoides]|uniref:uncharacterized protein n=1 Tax=Rutidosis leptorrhynchoides TaxID=125765 RepID=UPI003A998F6E